MIENLFKYTVIYLLSFLCLTPITAEAENGNKYNYDLKFEPIPSGVLPTNEVRILYQDSDGFIWLPTYSGLVRYDGYDIVNYGMDMPFNCYLNVVTEDQESNLWIAAEQGVFRFHKSTGEIEHIDDECLGTLNASDILCATNGDIYVSGDNGLFRKPKSQDKFMLIDLPNGHIGGISDIMEDARGHIWIAACESGLFRYDVESNRFHTYSDHVLHFAYTLHQDKKGQIWVGTWGRGLVRLKTPYTGGRMQYDRFHRQEGHSNTLNDNILYTINSDDSGTIWIGTRSGLSLMHDDRDFYSFENYLPGSESGQLPYNEVSSILITRDNQMWISMFGGGICKVRYDSRKFDMDRMDSVRERYHTSSIRSIFHVGGTKYWLGLIGFGMMLYDSETKSAMNYLEHPDFTNLPYTSTVDAIVRRKKTGEICFGTYNGGIWLYNENTHKVKIVNHFIGPTFNDCIHTMLDDSNGNIWIGTRHGVFILDTDDKVHSLSEWIPGINSDFLDSRVFDIKEDNEGNIWIATNYEGIVYISPKKRILKRYAVGNDNDIQNVFCLLVDSRQRIWAGSMWNGLSCYDPDRDRFVTVNSFSTLKNKGINNIVEDNSGKIWITTNSSVLSFAMNKAHELENINYYATSDRRGTFYFNHASSCLMPDGRLLLGSSHGICRFSTDKPNSKKSTHSLCFTDFKVYHKSLRSMTAEERNRYTPNDVNYADEITIGHKENNFTIEFSLLNYVNPQENMYAYRLENYDDNDIVVDAQHHFASYNNLPAGTYLFRLKGTNEDGMWDESERTLKIRVLPAPWQTWWAYCIYAIIVIIIFYIIFRIMRYKVKMRHKMEIDRIEKRKIEEINHVKLQFFTNITHEFMTPLSIILASLENLKQGGDINTLQRVMAANATRLMRLIQQVLEFRKAESGNLKIGVSYGNISAFIRNCADAFLPLFGKKRQQFDFESDPDDIHGFIDFDKMDKIIYNLLSNTAKYTPEDGRIALRISLPDGSDRLQIDISNSGEPMSQEKIDGLFKRFYEGDYRKHNTIGTGIGLALVKDLVELHHGTITVSSDEHTGNLFRITLPIDRASYNPDEIDDSVSADNKTPFPSHPIYTSPTLMPESSSTAPSEGEQTLLIVDDNEELCLLFSNLLSHYFNVKTANDGHAAIDILEKGGIDLVVSDIMMPGMDGIELCRYIKHKLEFSHIPVILLTAKRAEEDQIEGYNSGADAYISKPCNFSLLYAQITNCLERQKRRSADFRKQVVFEVNKPGYTPIDEQFLQRAIDCVNANISDSGFGLSEFVNEMGVSRSVLTEKLKSLTGLTPSAFVMNVRLTTACKFMTEQNKIRINELAFAVGFNDPKYFSTCFKKKYGMTPKEFMEQNLS